MADARDAGVAHRAERRRWRSSCSPATASSPARSAAAESIPGGFSAVYDVLRALDESGRVRRGFFVGGVAATQFALPPALDLLRSLRQPPDEPESGAPRRVGSREPVRRGAEVAARAR